MRCQLRVCQTVRYSPGTGARTACGWARGISGSWPSLLIRRRGYLTDGGATATPPPPHPYPPPPPTPLPSISSSAISARLQAFAFRPAGCLLPRACPSSNRPGRRCARQHGVSYRRQDGQGASEAALRRQAREGILPVSTQPFQAVNASRNSTRWRNLELTSLSPQILSANTRTHQIWSSAM